MASFSTLLTPALALACISISGIATAQPMPMWPPPNVCVYGEACREEGRCTWDGEECVATTDGECRASRGCADDGECTVDEDGGCEGGQERRSSGAFIAGLTLVGVGGASVLGGIVALVIGSMHNISGNGGGSGEVLGGGIAMGVGAGLAVLVGMPLAIYGGGHVSTGSAAIVVSPTGGHLTVRF